MINAFWHDLDFIVQEGAAEEWLRVIDTFRNTPEDISEPDRGEPVVDSLQSRRSLSRRSHAEPV